MRISDWSSDVCSSDLIPHLFRSSILTNIAQEAKEAEELLAEMTNGGGLEALILSRQAQRGSDMMSRLEAKYSAMAKDRKSVVEGKSVSVRVDLGGRGIIKKQTKYTKNNTKKNH